MVIVERLFKWFWNMCFTYFTMNIRYEVQGGNVKEKLKNCPGNTVIIPYLRFNDDRVRESIKDLVHF